MWRSVCILTLLSAVEASATVVRLLEDLAPATEVNSGSIDHLAVSGGSVFFCVPRPSVDGSGSPLEEIELWVLRDGRARVVRDLTPYSDGRCPRFLTSTERYVLFQTARITGAHGRGRDLLVWRSDGTAEGTTIVTRVEFSGGDTYTNEPVIDGVAPVNERSYIVVNTHFTDYGCPPVLWSGELQRVDPTGPAIPVDGAAEGLIVRLANSINFFRIARLEPAPHR